MISPIMKLNEDCVISIFDYLKIAGKVKIDRLSKGWPAIALRSWSSKYYMHMDPKSFELLHTSDDGCRDFGLRIVRKILFRCGSNVKKYRRNLHRIPLYAFADRDMLT